MIRLLRKETKCWRYLSDLSSVTPRYIGVGQTGRMFRQSLHSAHALLPGYVDGKLTPLFWFRLSFNRQFWRYAESVVMSWLRLPSTVSHLLAWCKMDR